MTDTQTTPHSSNQASGQPQDLQQLLGDGLQRHWWQRPALWLLALVLLGGAGGWWYWQGRQQAQAAPRFVTQEVSKGNITLTVTANGTLQPTRSVNIGSELSGTVRRVLVDVNDQVSKGQLLVELDTAKLQAQVARSRASVDAAQARLAQTQATVKEARANAARMQEVAQLSGGQVPSKAELDSSGAALERALADSASAQASVKDAQAALSTDETNLTKASIRSPIDGVVLSRVVEPGNAVAASLQAVTLLTLAEDLRKLRLEVNVDEADVGVVQPGQKASFTVSAYPARRYPARTTRVAFGSTKTDNVVTYITYLEVDNQDLSLRPGMTATAAIVSVEREDVLTVPNTALRFSPVQANGADAAGAAAQSGGGIMSQIMPRMPRSSTPRRAGTQNEGKGSAGTRRLWLLQDGQPQAVDVTTGISDGRVIEVQGTDLQAGMQVITDQLASGASNSGSASGASGASGAKGAKGAGGARP